MMLDHTETEIIEWSRAWRVRGSVPRPVNWVYVEAKAQRETVREAIDVAMQEEE